MKVILKSVLILLTFQYCGARDQAKNYSMYDTYGCYSREQLKMLDTFLYINCGNGFWATSDTEYVNLPFDRNKKPNELGCPIDDVIIFNNDVIELHEWSIQGHHVKHFWFIYNDSIFEIIDEYRNSDSIYHNLIETLLEYQIILDSTEQNKIELLARKLESRNNFSDDVIIIDVPAKD